MSLTKSYVILTFILLILTFAELSIFGHQEWGPRRTHFLLTLMSMKALTVALAYMNLKAEPLTLKLTFFVLIPVSIYFLLFMLYDARFVWLS